MEKHQQLESSPLGTSSQYSNHTHHMNKSMFSTTSSGPLHHKAHVYGTPNTTAAVDHNHSRATPSTVNNIEPVFLDDDLQNDNAPASTGHHAATAPAKVPLGETHKSACSDASVATQKLPVGGDLNLAALRHRAVES